MTDTCLITTTIHTPQVLRQYRASDPDVLMIIAGDLQSPHDDIKALCKELGNAQYLDPFTQQGLGYACSEVIGFRSIQRRNIALLEALRAGADVVLSVDDDNAPCHGHYFAGLRQSFAAPMGMLGVGSDGWFNLGDHAAPEYFYRGFPFSLRQRSVIYHDCEIIQAKARRVGMVNGLIYGDPDINAIDRYSDGGPRVTGYSLGERDDYPAGLDGIYVNPRTTWTPINSQNTAYVRDLAPLAFVLPGIGRYDDIWASFVALRIMETTDYHVYFGEPSVVQERNPHHWIIDLEREIYGMKHTEAFCQGLKETRLKDGESVLDALDRIRLGPAAALLPPQTREFMAAWGDDVARVL